MYRIGFSKDSHLLVLGDHILLGGVKISANVQVDAYSDGDVLLHSLCEAIFGALGLEDLGTYYQPKNMPPNFSSTLIVKDVLQKLEEEHYQISNFDIMIVLDQPHLKQFKSQIKDNLAQLFKIKTNQIAVKATNTDGYDQKRIHVYSNVLIYKGDQIHG